jgi:hypothetical protein
MLREMLKLALQDRVCQRLAATAGNGTRWVNGHSSSAAAVHMMLTGRTILNPAVVNLTDHQHLAKCNPEARKT